MSGRITLEMLEALKNDEEEMPRFPLYFNQFSKPNREQNLKDYKAFVVAEKRKAKEERHKKQKRKEIGDSSKPSAKEPSFRKGTTRHGKRSGKSADTSLDEAACSTENEDVTFPEVPLSKEAQKRLQKIHEEFEKEREEMRKICVNLSNSPVTADDDVLLNDIVFYDPLVDDINVKVRCTGNILVKRIRREDKLAEVFRHIAKEYDVPAVQMIIYFKDLPVNVNDTPKQLGMTLADILECVIFPPTKASPDTINCINLKLQSKDSKIKTVITVHVVDPFSVMMEKYAKIKRLPLDKLVFEFDGDKISPNETPLDLEIENEHVIDVKVIS